MEYSKVRKIIDYLKIIPSPNIRWISSKEGYLKENKDCVPGCYISQYGFYAIATLDTGDVITLCNSDPKIRLCSHDDFYEDSIVLGLQGTYEKRTYSLNNVLKAQIVLANSKEEFEQCGVKKLKTLM